MGLCALFILVVKHIYYCMQDRTSEILAQYIRINGYQIDKTEVEYQFKSSPYYPSLRAMTAVLDHFAIEHIAAEVAREKDIIPQLPASFMAHLVNDRFVLVLRKDKKLAVTFDNGSKRQMTNDEFLEVWDGVVLVVEENAQKAVFSVSKVQRYIAPAVIVAIVAAAIGLNGTAFAAVHSVLCLLGGFIAYLIVRHELGRGGKLVDAVCSGGGERISCNDVLKSKGAMVFGRYSFGQIGLSFFVMLGLAWFFASLYSFSSVPIIQLTLVALPFTLYSIFYQLLAVKKWCTLCLSVVVTLWLMGASIFLYNETLNLFRINVRELVGLAILFAAAFLVIDLWIRKVKEGQDFSELKVRSKRFKQKLNVYTSLVKAIKTVETRINSPEIVLGDRNSALEVVIITSPLCGFCKEVHSMVEQMLRAKASVKFTIRFNIRDTAGFGAQICARLIEIYLLDGEEKCREALSDAYLNIPLGKWEGKHGKLQDEKVLEVIANQRSWCDYHNISFTPEILINGKSFPKDYDRIDLPVVLESLAENVEELSVC